MPPCGTRPWALSGGRWTSTRRPPHGTNGAPRTIEAGLSGSATGRCLRTGCQPAVGLQTLPDPGAGRRMAGPLAAWDRGPLAPGALPLAQDPGAVRLRLPAQPGPPPGARADRAELHRTDSQCDRAGSARGWENPSRDCPGGQGGGRWLLGAVLDLGDAHDLAGACPAGEPAGAQSQAAGLP